MQVVEKLATISDETTLAAFGEALAKQFGVPNEPRQQAALARATNPFISRLSNNILTVIDSEIAEVTLVPGIAVLPESAPLDPPHRPFFRQNHSQAATIALHKAFVSVGAAEALLEILRAGWSVEPSPAVRPDPYRRAAQARLVATLAPSLRPDLSSIGPVTEDLLTMLRHNEDYVAREAVARALEALAGKLPDAQREQALTASKAALANTGSTEEAIAWAEAIAALLPDEPRAATAEIVEALKYPTATGMATEVLLAGLATPWSTEYLPIAGKRLTDRGVLEWLKAHVPEDYSLAEPPRLTPAIASALQ